MNELAHLDEATKRAIESAMVAGDLSQLTTDQRIFHYIQTCHSLGLNHRTQPFDYLRLNGKLQLYARKDCTDQLRSIRGVSVIRLEHSRVDTVLVVTAHGRDKSGREDLASGAVNIEKLRGDALANAMMKAETKAKRRLTLSLCGLGMIDETEIETIPGATIETSPVPKVQPVYHPAKTATPRAIADADPGHAPHQDTGFGEPPIDLNVIDRIFDLMDKLDQKFSNPNVLRRLTEITGHNIKSADDITGLTEDQGEVLIAKLQESLDAKRAKKASKEATNAAS